jgi:membrane protease YdiL (CAAX protease family)
VTHPTIALLVVLFLLLVMPIRGRLNMRRIKREGTPAALMHSYLLTIGTMWLLAAIVTWLAGNDGLWYPPRRLAPSMRLEHVPYAAAIAVTVALLVGFIGPVVFARRTPRSVVQQLEPIRFMLPESSAQRWTFALVCITAGIAEEWIYRGFLLHYLTVAFPTLNGWWIVVAAAVMFGIAHAYQGRTGTILTGVLGFVFSLLYIRLGSLLIPMILHTLLDLRVFLLLPALRTGTNIDPATRRP